jgi:hypothetical protein
VIVLGVRLLSVFALALASVPADAGVARKPVALMAAPARVVLAGTNGCSRDELRDEARRRRRFQGGLRAHARPSAAARVAVRVRLGVVVTVRAPGIVVRRLVLRRLSVARRGRRRLLELRVSNRGNVTETLARVHVTVSRVRTGRRLVTLGTARRDVRPHSQGILEFRLRRRMRGAVTVRVLIPAAPGRRAIHRTYAIHL